MSASPRRSLRSTRTKSFSGSTTLEVQSPSATSVRFLISEVPRAFQALPPNGYLFLIGFAFFPAWWLGAFLPRTSSGSDTAAFAEPTVLSEKQAAHLRRYSWRSNHTGVLPAVGRCYLRSFRFALCADIVPVLPKERKSGDRRSSVRRFSDFLTDEGSSNTTKLPTKWVRYMTSCFTRGQMMLTYIATGF